MADFNVRAAPAESTMSKLDARTVPASPSSSD
jgi:hypothetical protein